MLIALAALLIASELAPDPELVRYRYALNLPDAADEIGPAIDVLEARMKEAPNPFDAEELAALYYRQGEYRASEAMARRSNRARLTFAKLANARHEFKRAIELARSLPKSAGAYQVIATAHLALGESEAAVDAANTMVALKPDSNSHLLRALAMEAAGRDLDAALDFSRAAMREEWGDKQSAARLRTLWGRFLMRRGEDESAALLFEEALRIVPQFAPALAGRGELARRKGDAREAAAQLEKAFAVSRQVRYLIDQARAEELAGNARSADRLRARAELFVRSELELGHRLELVELLIDRGGRERLEEAVELARAELATRQHAEVRHQLDRALARLGSR